MKTKGRMRICFTSDLHGHAALYRELDALLVRERPELLVLGGDLFPDGDLDDPVGTQGKYVADDFLPRVRDWRKRVAGLHVACIFGNHDWLSSKDVLSKHKDASAVVILTHRLPWTVGGLSFLGYSPTPPTPYWVKDFERLDLPDDPMPETGGAIWDSRVQQVLAAEPDKYFQQTEAVATELRDAAACQPPWIFVSHAPPYDTKLDRLPHLDYPIGSRAVRRFIEQRQPLCALHGHIHESPFVTGSFTDQLGASLCINPGQGSALHAVLFDSRDPRGTLRHTVFG